MQLMLEVGANKLRNIPDFSFLIIDY